MKPQFSYTLFLFLVPLLLFSCQDNDDFQNPNNPEVIPTVVAYAGLDQSITLPQSTVALDGSQSTVTNGEIARYNWAKVSGPSSFSLNDPTAARTVVSNLENGEYQFELKVTALGGISSRDTVKVIVKAEPTYEHWTRLNYLPANDFFFGSGDWFGGANILMGIGDQVFAVSNKGIVFQLSGTNNWQTKGNFPEQMERPPLVFSFGNRGYCLRGAHLWQYDVGQNLWQLKREVPEQIRDAQVALVLKSRVYLVSTSMGKVMSYDFATDTYSPEKDYQGSGTSTGFVVKGKGYCVEEKGRCWEFDPETGTWRQRASLPQPITRMTGFYLNNHGYVLSDVGNAAYNHSLPMKVWRYDPAADLWTEFEEGYPGFGVNDVQATSLGNRVYVGLGYHNGDFTTTDLWLFD
ncbi:PKD domain-containing protein [Rufibacter latericius]|uniref:PKD/Chitinase domain-containing protein n=1 Tax=Rufibacter latericius TaxID=2487040 RepID=A0A3M9MAB4_9BACT|nr:hypothetical protein [Rufibacter latericius]RNI22502.1 hypothetical protein EFB08_20605 [Rufibacter latericius]